MSGSYESKMNLVVPLDAEKLAALVVLYVCKIAFPVSLLRQAIAVNIVYERFGERFCKAEASHQPLRQLLRTWGLHQQFLQEFVWFVFNIIRRYGSLCGPTSSSWRGRQTRFFLAFWEEKESLSLICSKVNFVLRSNTLKF